MYFIVHAAFVRIKLMMMMMMIGVATRGRGAWDASAQCTPRTRIPSIFPLCAGLTSAVTWIMHQKWSTTKELRSFLERGLYPSKTPLR